MKMKCPHCGVKGSLDDSFLHKKIRCPRCQQIFRADPDEVLTDEQAIVTGTSDVIPALAGVPGDEAGYDRPENHVGEFASQVQNRLDDILTSGVHCSRCGMVEPEEAAFSQTDRGLLCPACLIARSGFTGKAEAETSGNGASPVAPPLPPVPPSTAQEFGRRADTDFAPPENEITDHPRNVGSLPFSVGGTLQEAWRLTNGAKGPIWIAILVTILIMGSLGSLMAIPAYFSGTETSAATGGMFSSIVNLLMNILSTILSAGLMYMGVRRATDRSLSWKMLFSGLPVALSICIASILQMICVGIGCLLLLLPGIYLLVGYCMTLPLIIDQRLSPWQAMETSRRAVHKIWWKVFGLFVVIMLISMVSAVPLFIGLIWTVPMYFVVGGVLYRHLFGMTNGHADLAKIG